MARWNEITARHYWLIQIDIAGHSKWMSSQPSKPDVASARAELAERMSSGLGLHSFKVAFWAGDGGLFTASMDKMPANNLDAAIDEAFNCFNAWQSQQGKQDRSQLGLRLSVHADQVYVHPNPGYWYSDELSAFLKKERDLSEVGAATITEKVYKQFSADRQSHWSHLRDVQVGDNGEWSLYVRRMMDSTTKLDSGVALPSHQVCASSREQSANSASETDKKIYSIILDKLSWGKVQEIARICTSHVHPHRVTN